MLLIDNLTIRFKTSTGFVEAVKSVSFQLTRGRTLGIVGESGSGKSVTALAIMRLLNEQQCVISGTISFNTSDLTTLAEKEMRQLRGNRIAMIFQEPMTSLNPVLTCGQQVIEAIRLHKSITRIEARKLAVDLFKEVQLPRPENLLDSYPHQLSGGQRQRVMIAMALSCDPELLIADEPTTALDVTVQKTITELLLRLKQDRGMSLLFISHDLGVISQIADDVLVMYKGEVVEHATVEDIFNNPQHPYTKGLLVCRPSPKYQLTKLPVIADFLAFDNDGRVTGTESTITDIRERYSYADNKIDEHKVQLYNGKPLLQVKQLATWFPVAGNWFASKKNFIKAVDGVSFDVYPSETLGLVGESGSGKTTLGRSLLRLVEPTAGQVIFDDVHLQTLNAEELRDMRRRMQLIFQDPYSSLNPRKTIGQALIEPMQVHHLFSSDKQRMQTAFELLERVNLSPAHFNRYPHEFSGGQRQRVVIARALAVQPQFIVCDESVSALDVSVQAQILNLLRELQQQLNLTYIFISHDLSVIKHISDRIMVMNKGRIEEINAADQLYNHPETAYTKKLISAIPLNKFGA